MSLCNKRNLVSFCAAGALAVASLGAYAADFNWTGLGDGHSWSDANNWTNAEGVAVAPAVAENVKHSYHFPVDDTGLVVTQDMKGAIIISTLTFERTSTAPVTVEMASKELDCVLYVGTQGTVTVPEGMTLLWKGDANRWNNQDVTKNGPGKVIFDYLRSPGTQRGFVLNEGTVEVAETSANTYFHVKMGGTDLANPPLFINHKDGGTVGGLDVLRASGTVKLEGTTLNVGAPSNITGSTNTLPTVIADGGTLVFQNERVAKLSEKTPSFNIALGRADVIAPDFNAASILWTFDDASDPTKDTVGSGSRMVKSASGSLSVMEDATRGSVLSFTGGAYLNGPDDANWLDGFEPTEGFTVAFWLKPDANCNDVAKILFWGQNTADNALAMRLNTTSGKNLMVTTWYGNQEIPITTLRDGNWHHIAVTYTGLKTGENIAVYYDGTNIHRFARNVYNPLKKDLYIGNMDGTAWGYAGGSAPYTGLMDDFVLAPRAFTAKEVASLAANGVASVLGKTELNDVAAESAGVLAVQSRDISVKTLSGNALAGGVEIQKAGATFAVGASAGAAGTTFKGVIGGEESTLVKKGADYALSLSGAAKGVTNVVVEAGTLSLKRPLARRGLVFRCSFDDAGDVAHDSSPGGMALEITNSVPVSVVGGGVSGTAGRFPGNGTFIGSGMSCLPSCLPRGNESYTVSAWIKPTAEACSGTVPICCWGHPDNYRLVMLRFNGAGAIMFSNYGADHGVSGLSDLTDGNWHHIVATYDGSNRRKCLYYDGVQKLDTTLGADLNVGNASYPFELGHTSTISSRLNQFYTGDMDEFMVFDYAWDADEVTAEYNHTAAPENVAVESLLPVPVARWTFDGESPLADTTGNAALTLSYGAGTNGSTDVSFESGDAICGKAARFTDTGGFLTLGTFPTGIIPTGNPNCTIVVRYRPDEAQLKGIYSPVVGWGADNGWSDGTLVRIGVGYESSLSARGLLRGVTMEADDARRTPLGTDRSRWYTVALVFQTPALRDNKNVTGWLVVDGEIRKSARMWNDMAIAAQDFCIGSNAEGTKNFRGLVDDVQIYDRVLSPGQIRMITERFEASKGKATTETAIPAGVLTSQPDVSVASGAKLRVASTETVGTLSGAGTVEIAPLARLNIGSTDGFTGSVTGGGAVGFADGAELDIGDGSSPVVDIDHVLALGANVNVTTTARAGTILVARTSGFADAGNLSTWTATAPGNRMYRFAVTKDGRLYLMLDLGMRVIVR
ncbi:MAG: laminin G domain-containing protein [Kiritimatiellae bacterium]|nr:laminin G domain-containing protein [Kiritimatiellia bacterium]